MPRASGETVSQAIYDQYTPASTEDAIPRTVEGQLLGLADRIQTITAMFGIGNAPTGSKDPFALRRAANAIVKILAESDLPLTLSDVLKAESCRRGRRTTGFRLLPRTPALLPQGRARLRLRRRQRGPGRRRDDVRDAIARAEALTAVRGSEDFAAISAAFKRIKNILRQAEEKKFVIGSADAHQAGCGSAGPARCRRLPGAQSCRLRQERAYIPALVEIATLRPVVDAFFDKVMVLDPDPDIRGAHLGLIDGVLRGFSGIADFSEIVTG